MSVDIDARSILTLRMLALDQVEAAQSGHSGLPLGAAPMAYTLLSRFMRYDPADPQWPNRDRFVLSAGHGSALLYAMLHLAGYDLPIEELERFRKLGSRTPGHPEYGLTPGVETTTGPLGQGFATGVGMALAGKMAAARLNGEQTTLLDYRVFGIVSDGDLMEGVASEAASLAGHLQLDNLVYLYDDNHISIEGSTDLAFSEDVEARFAAYGWHTGHVEDGEDIGAIEAAVKTALSSGRPSLIRVRTHIGYGTPLQDTAAAHSNPLGVERTKETRRRLGWPEDAYFFVPPEVRGHFGRLAELGRRRHEAWRALLSTFSLQEPERYRLWHQIRQHAFGDGDWEAMPRFGTDKAMATRQASGQILNALKSRLPWLVGGSADLAPSNDTYLKDEGDINHGAFSGRNLHFGVREHAMGAALNGMALEGNFRPYGGTFLIFSDYLRPAIRLAALMELPVTYVFTHDSIGVGEDGPTHQPVEQLGSLRTIPGLTVWRPADANETSYAWRSALTRNDGPTALVLSRQALPVMPPHDDTRRGGYVLRDASGTPDIILMASGSEVSLVLSAADVLAQRGVQVRVVSMPSMEVFEAQDEAYRTTVLPPDVRLRLAVEAAQPVSWYRYIGIDGAVIGMTRFGASGKASDLFKEFGFTAQAVVDRAEELLKQGGRA